MIVYPIANFSYLAHIISTHFSLRIFYIQAKPTFAYLYDFISTRFVFFLPTQMLYPHECTCFSTYPISYPYDSNVFLPIRLSIHAISFFLTYHMFYPHDSSGFLANNFSIHTIPSFLTSTSLYPHAFLFSHLYDFVSTLFQICE